MCMHLFQTGKCIYVYMCMCGVPVFVCGSSLTTEKQGGVKKELRQTNKKPDNFLCEGIELAPAKATNNEQLEI